MTRRGLITVLTFALIVPLGSARAEEPTDPPPPRCEMGSCYDPLFTVQYPYTHSIVTSGNVRVKLPARYYDLEGAAIIGHGDLATMQEWTSGTEFEPVRTETGTGVAALWIIRYLDTDLAPYDEAITTFAVNTEAVTIPDSPGAMLAALIDPANRIWSRGLILDEQLPIDAGREYLFIPKEPDPKSMSIALASLEGELSFEFTEPDGTSIATGDIRFDPIAAGGPALQFGGRDGAQRFGLDVVGRGGNFRLGFVFRNIEQPDAIATLTGVGRFTNGVVIAECCAGSEITFNEATPFGADLTALHLEPRLILAVPSKGARFVLDIDL